MDLNHQEIPTKSPAEAKQLLVEGNERFVSGAILKNNQGDVRRKELFEAGQHPFAVVITCSDSRVPPELIFDQGLGDLFVVRVAGNVMDEIAMGSVEYGVEHLRTPLVVVMGHEKCGAVKATVDEEEAPGSIGAIAAKIRPSVDKAKLDGATGSDLYEKATDENILVTMAEIKNSPVVKHLLSQGNLEIIGAKYHLQSGKVTFM